MRREPRKLGIKLVFEEKTPKQVEATLRSAYPGLGVVLAGFLGCLVLFFGKLPALCPFKTFIIGTVTGKVI
jgi:hypothetical protein